MSAKDDELTAQMAENCALKLLGYYVARQAWKLASSGPQKVAAKEAMERAHGIMLEAAKQYGEQISKKAPER